MSFTLIQIWEREKGHFWLESDIKGNQTFCFGLSVPGREGRSSVRSHAAKQHLTEMVISELVFETRSKENGTDSRQGGGGPTADGRRRRRSIRRIEPEMEKRRRGDKLGRRRDGSEFRVRTTS